MVNDANVGFFSIHDFCGFHRCNLGTWIDPRYRGPNTVLLGKKTLQFLHGDKKIQNVFTVTPWNAASKLCMSMGMSPVAEIPNFAKIKDKVRNVEVLHSEVNLCRYHMQMDLVKQELSDQEIASRLAQTFEG